MKMCPMKFCKPTEHDGNYFCEEENCVWYLVSMSRCAVNVAGASAFAVLENEVRRAAAVLSHHSLLVVDDVQKRQPEDPGEGGADGA